MDTFRLILLRHGESIWNNENRFTGWQDVDLSELGYKEAERAADLLCSFRLEFDISFTSFLKRSIKTQQIVAERMNLLWTPIIKDWRLNERHYGALEGLNKGESMEKFGYEQVLAWRRGYDCVPPLVIPEDPRYPIHQKPYKNFPKELLPKGESLAMTAQRAMMCWRECITPALKEGKTPLIAAHGNTIRALVKELDQISDREIPQLEIPTGKPLIYILNRELHPVDHFFL